MRAVILAAGDGGRLGARTAYTPKPLVQLNGRPIIAYTLDALACAGVSEAIVVTGYREAQVMAALSALRPPGIDISFVSNPHFEAGASLSLRAARESMGEEPFLLTMSDHVLSAPLLARLAAAGRAARPGHSLIAADRSHHDAEYVDEATKIAIDSDGFVTAIGKQLCATSALDTGAFFLAAGAWAAVDAVAEDCELSTIFGELARRRALRAVDVSGAFWYDIDTAEDLAAASAALGGAESRIAVASGAAGAG